MRSAGIRCAVFAALALAAQGAIADEGGTSFWLPGQQGSFAALPGEAGWSMPVAYYHTAADASVAKTFAIGGNVRLGLDAKADLLMAIPTYTFGSPVAGGQASLALTGLLGRVTLGTNATLTAPSGAVVSGAKTETTSGIGDLFATGTLKWSRGDHHTMAYTMLGVPVGSYDANRLANIGANHWALDAGGGYTYLDAKAGHEFSAVLGFTYNFGNPDTQYKNGLSSHLDWGASQFVSEQVHVGLVGYFYKQLTADSGSGAVLGDFKSQVCGIGPQAGYFFKVGDRQWYANLKGYYEFNAKNRPEGWNLWLAIAIPLGSAAR